jgi:hypothetical protein
MPQSRQLAAIMFTDIVGYTALMGDDEQKAFSILAKNRELQNAQGEYSFFQTLWTSVGNAHCW